MNSKSDPSLYHLILKNVQKHVTLTKEEKDIFTSMLKFKKLRKKQYLVQEGDVCKFEAFVNKGCLRAYSVDENGFEHIVLFALEDWWIGDLYSFLTQRPATYNIDALEDCELLLIDKKNLEDLYSKVPKFERVFRIMMQNAFIAQQQRIVESLSFPAIERYTHFIKKYPQLDQRLPQHQIASYLGITPEFLSKIRKSLSTKQIKKS